MKLEKGVHKKENIIKKELRGKSSYKESTWRKMMLKRIKKKIWLSV